MKKILVIFLSIITLTTNAYAIEEYEDFSDVVLENDPVTAEFEAIADSLPDLSTILPEPSADTADGGSVEEVKDPPSSHLLDSPLVLYDSTYGGAWSGSVLDYFSGVMRGHPFSDYLCYRANQNTYVLYYGVDIKFTNGYFQGSDLHKISYNTYNNYNQNEYVSFSDGQSVYYQSDGIFYSNVYDNAAHLEGVRTIEYIIIACVLLCVLLFVSAIRMFMKAR